MVVDGKDGASAKIEVSQDPDVPLNDADRRVYDEAARRAYELNRRANEAANTVVDLNEQFSPVEKAVEKHDLAEVKEISERLEVLRRRFGVFRRQRGRPADEDVRGNISRLRGAILGATAVPTEAQTRLLAKLSGELDEVIAELNETLSSISELYRDLATKGLYPATPKVVSP